MRDSWSKDSVYMAFDCGPHGWLNGGHAHADLLSFQIDYNSLPVIVDSGTYTYSGKWRNRYRGPDGHCSIKIDDFHPAMPNGPFHWCSAPDYKLLNWVTTDSYDYIRGKLSGSKSWTQEREIVFLKPSYFCLVDQVNGVGTHNMKIRFPLKGLDWQVEHTKCIGTLNKNKLCVIELLNTDELRLELMNSWISPVFGQKEPSKSLVLNGIVTLPFKYILFIDLSSEQTRVELLSSMGKEYINLTSDYIKPGVVHIGRGEFQSGINPTIQKIIISQFG